MELISSIKATPSIAIINKTDLSPRIDTNYIRDNFEYIVYISALTGDGLECLKNEAEKLLKTREFSLADGAIYTERQREDVRKALECVTEAETAVLYGYTLDAVTVSVEGAVSSLLELTGERVSDTVIDSVFEKFCVGK